MAKGPERTFKDYVNQRIDKSIYQQSMYTPYSRGTPDNYYETDGGRFLWVEFKHMKNLPVRKPFVDLSDHKKFLTGPQQVWLRRAHRNGIPVAVAVGVGTTHAFFAIGDEWQKPIAVSDINLIPKQEAPKELEQILYCTNPKGL